MKPKFIRWLCCVLLLAAFFLLAACGPVGGATPSADSEVVGDAARGESLYKKTVIGPGSAPGCITCHSLDEGVTLVGPSHAGLGLKAAEIVPDQSADSYLRTSIVEPNQHITEGFEKGVMYANYGQELSDQEIADLVAFLESLD